MFENAKDHWDNSAQRLVIDCLTHGIKRARPANIIDRKAALQNDILQIDDAEYDLTEYENIYIVGGGNPAGHIASELAAILGDAITEGMVVTDDPQEAAGIEVLEGSHPIPSQTGVSNTQRMRRLVTDADEDDLVLAVIAGGGSALLTAPREGISLEELQETTSALLQSGASISEINTLRKHLSAIKGGQLATEASPATTVGLIFSDVVGDDLSTVASGPIVSDDTTFATALNVLNNYDITVPSTVQELLEAGDRGKVNETPDATHSAFESTVTHVLATGCDAVIGAADRARDRDIEPMILSSRVRGEASEAALTHVAVAEEILATGNPIEPPIAVVSGGETTVTVSGDGRGGPNQEFALSAALELPTQVVLASVDTDGIDGTTDAAGALVDVRTVSDQQAARRALAENNTYDYLDKQNCLLTSGPTGTNVNDLRVMVVGEI